MTRTITIIMTVTALFFFFSCANPMGSDSSNSDNTLPGQIPEDNGVLVDEEQGLVAGFTLDENIDENS